MTSETLNPYGKSRFWQAYAELYWPELDANVGLGSFGVALADALPKRQSDEVITILLLGFGFGGVELPILYHLKQRSKARLRCICIDQALPPMRFAQHLLRAGLAKLPKTPGEIVAQFHEFAPSWRDNVQVPEGKLSLKTPDGDEFIFVQDDLNWESKTKVFPPLPSKWHERLGGILPPNQGVDLIFAAFSLFHIRWWRSVLMHSLGWLKADGLFLHGKVEGDEGLFEGRPGSPDSPNTIAVDFFQNGFFSDKQVESIIKTPRAASASQPFVIEAFLSRLEDFGLTRVGALHDTPFGDFPDGYTVPASVGLPVYSALLETQGFSTFRYIATELKKTGGDFASLCSSLREKYRDRTGNDTLSIVFQWTVCQLSSSKTLARFPLRHRFRQEHRPTHQNPPERALHDAYVTAYELSTPLQLQECQRSLKLTHLGSKWKASN